MAGEKQFYPVLVLFYPGLDEFCMVYTQIVKHQKNLLLAVSNQTCHEVDQLLGIHVVFVEYKVQFPTLGNSGKHLDLHFLASTLTTGV